MRRNTLGTSSATKGGLLSCIIVVCTLSCEGLQQPNAGKADAEADDWLSPVPAALRDAYFMDDNLKELRFWELGKSAFEYMERKLNGHESFVKVDKEFVADVLRMALIADTLDDANLYIARAVYTRPEPTGFTVYYFNNGCIDVQHDIPGSMTYKLKKTALLVEAPGKLNAAYVECFVAK